MITHIKAYIELARLDKPAGFMLLFWPCAFAIILGDFYSSINYYALGLFFIGAVSMRAAGCVINDIIDRKVDAQVERTKNRPLASGRLNIADAICLLFLLCTIGLTVFMRLGNIAMMYAFGAFMLALVYPLMKRVFGFPQLFLGIVFNSGALVAWANTNGDISLTAFLLYVGCIFWTIGYDTIYGHMDKKDDVKIGVKSTAITFGKNSRFIIWLCFVLSFTFITAASCIERGGEPYIYCLPALSHMGWVLSKTNFEEPKTCMWAFKQIAFITGLLYFIGLYLSKIL
jgi:4-hydroxybenzoate polyprenyltransferase